MDQSKQYVFLQLQHGVTIEYYWQWLSTALSFASIEQQVQLLWLPTAANYLPEIVNSPQPLAVELSNLLKHWQLYGIQQLSYVYDHNITAFELLSAKRISATQASNIVHRCDHIFS